MGIYKAESGRLARTIMCLLCVAFSLYAASSWYASFSMDFVLDGSSVSLGHIGAFTLSLFGLWVSYIYCFVKPSTVDGLIDVEREMRKCTWPDVEPWLKPDTAAWGATYIVIIVMLILATFIAFVDVIIEKVMEIGIYS